ncbi:MAG: ABC transporter ATP-binding protein [Ferruginibacter sp.]|nr:ABC transporter ATP-binding protein [Ferruginibacter sp.]
MYCVETRELSHGFAGHPAVLNSINMQVPTGSIYGFLGPNGAGKTTTLRLLLGLISKQQGEIMLFNKTLKGNRIEILKQTGTMIESPSLYGHLTATENLLLYQKLFQCQRSRIKEVLDTVGLSDTGNKKAGEFSLGMKQRLSLAVALLHNPSLLILDEPTNGLDPNGIIEIRDLLKKLNETLAVSIIISSHLLSEIEKLVTHVGIISKGTMVFQGTLESLVNKQQQHANLVIDTSNLPLSAEIARQFEPTATTANGKLLMPIPSKETIATINRAFVQAGIDVYEMSTNKKDLESIFMELIK